MNTAKIAALYPLFLDSLRHPNGTQQMEGLLVRLLQAELVPTSRSYSHSIALTDFDHPGQHADWLAEAAGVTIQEFTPVRVFNWVRQQMPTLATDWQRKPVTGWYVELHATRRQPASGPEILLSTATTSAELAPVLRGLRTYQAKRRKRARKQLAQLRAYHAQQLAAEALRATMQAAAPADILLPTYGITRAEYWRRTDAAEDLAEQKQQNGGQLNGAYGYDILWHPDFPVGCVRSFSHMGLYEVEAFLSGNLAQNLNSERQLDRADYLYLADCLREGLADNPTPLAALRLARALAWVEQAAEDLLPTAQPHLTTSLPEAAPTLAA